MRKVQSLFFITAAFLGFWNGSALASGTTLKCHSDVIGNFTYERDEKGFQNLKVLDEKGEVVSLRTSHFPNPNTSYISGDVWQEGNTTKYNIQVGAGGKVDWSLPENHNVCYRHQPYRAFWIYGEGTPVEGTLTLSNFAEINPRAEVSYYPELIYVTHTIRSVWLDGHRCPNYYKSMADETHYKVSCKLE